MIRLAAISVALALVLAAWIAIPADEDPAECQSCTARHSALQRLQETRQDTAENDLVDAAEVATDN